MTTLRDNGARNAVGFAIREGANRGYFPSPRMLVCGRPIVATRGHFWWCNQEADGEAEIRRAVRQLVHEGADHIKVMALGRRDAGARSPAAPRTRPPSCAPPPTRRTSSAG